MSHDQPESECPFILKNLNPLYQTCPVPGFVESGPMFLKYYQCSYEEEFKCRQTGIRKVMRPMLKRHSDTKLSIN